MKLLSIDVGIKNLALCLFDIENKDKYEIEKWNVVSLCNEKVVNCSCGKKATYCYDKNYYCKKHSKDSGRTISPVELEINKLKKKKIGRYKGDINNPPNRV